MGKKGNVALGTALAAGVGYIAGVLTAPKSGRETRKEIRKKAQAAKSEAEQKLKQTYSELSKLLDQAQTKVAEGKDKVSKEVNEAIKKAEAARQKVRELLSAIHEGEADDKDLNKSLEEAKQALEHLKKYLDKKADAQ